MPKPASSKKDDGKSKATKKSNDSARSSTKKQSTKTVLDKIIYAIRNQPKTGSSGGVSRVAISKYLNSEFQYNNTTAFKLALKKGVDNNKLVQTGQSFRVAGDPIETPQEESEENKLQIEDISSSSSKTGSDGQNNDTEQAQDGDTVTVKYVGKLDNGYKFDSASSFTFVLGAGEVIKGWDQGVKGMKVGGVRKLTVPSKLGYGKRGCAPDIPPNATLHFVVTLKKISN